MRALTFALVLAACGKSSPAPVPEPEPEPPPSKPSPDAAPVATTPIPEDSRQLVVGRSRSWTATAVTLQRYERAGPGASWKPAGEPIAASLGRAGLGWGLGLHGDHAPEGLSGPIKVEGDGRSPAGLFGLGAAFGYAAEPPPGTAIEYVQVTESWRCVDDPESSRYNQVLSIEGSAPGRGDWKSAETMRRRDELYRRGLLVDHNAIELGARRTRPARPAGGSCVFLHIWRSPGSPTAGCAAMDAAALEALIAWLRPDAHPVIALLPEPQYARLARRWRLP